MSKFVTTKYEDGLKLTITEQVIVMTCDNNFQLTWLESVVDLTNDWLDKNFNQELNEIGFNIFMPHPEKIYLHNKENNKYYSLIWNNFQTFNEFTYSNNCLIFVKEDN